MTFASEQIEIAVEPSARSGVTWGAIIGGAFAAAAISLILMVLGSGLGLSVVSPWANIGASGTAVAVGAVVWLVVVQWIASGFGGYLTGRMRARSNDPSDEVFFRDTANGFLAWAVATLLVAGLLTSALSAIVGTGAQVAATVTSGAAQGAMQGGIQAATGMTADPTAYFVDTLYRPDTGAASSAATATPPADTTTTAASTTDMATAPAMAPAAIAPAMGVMAPIRDETETSANDVRTETGRILLSGLATETFPAEDADYLASLVASRTGMSAEAAKARVTDVVTKMQTAKTEAQAAADAARKAGAKLALYMFLSLLVGAFIAAAAAALGGGHRDDRPATMVR